MVINHGAKPNIRNGELLVWAESMKLMAELDNVSCKFSGLLTEAEDKRVLQGRIECDDAYLGGANKSQGLNSHSKKKVPFLAAVQTDESHHPHHAVSSQLHSFTYEQLKEWGQKHFCASACLLSDTAGFYKGIDNICEHRTYNKSQLGPVLVKKSFKWTDTIQTSFSGAIHAFDFRKYGCRYLGKFRFKAMFL